MLAATERAGRWQLRIEQDHPVLFGHPVDHAPGMLLLEALRQAAHGSPCPGHGGAPDVRLGPGLGGVGRPRLGVRHTPAPQRAVCRRRTGRQDLSQRQGGHRDRTGRPDPRTAVPGALPGVGRRRPPARQPVSGDPWEAPVRVPERPR
ncbi:AfsA-related hotdog domain-containing protein [Streptomyces sp. NPDC015171]|uniref:AfsA-related hotdog domain-containing protein n=1 Tax=Streptomyces sp. NPDC015171 TaxID=3364945 RepID=UPI0036F9FD01